MTETESVPADIAELLRRAYAAFNARDVGAVLATKRHHCSAEGAQG